MAKMKKRTGPVKVWRVNPGNGRLQETSARAAGKLYRCTMGPDGEECYVELTDAEQAQREAEIADFIANRPTA